MTSLIALPNDHFAVKVPEGATQFELHDEPKPHITYHVGMGTEDYDILRDTLSPGSYTIVALGSEISEEQAGEIVEFNQYGHNGWKTYTEELMFWEQSAVDSLKTLLASLSLSASTVVIIKQNK